MFATLGWLLEQILAMGLPILGFLIIMECHLLEKKRRKAIIAQERSEEIQLAHLWH